MVLLQTTINDVGDPFSDTVNTAICQFIV